MDETNKTHKTKIRNLIYTDEFNEFYALNTFRIMTRQLDPAKLAKLHNVDDLIDERYGKEGTPTREAFHNRAISWYYAEMLKDTRKAKKITQKALAEKIGKKREYVALLEKGETDMQLSTFLNISQALGLKFALL